MQASCPCDQQDLLEVISGSQPWEEWITPNFCPRVRNIIPTWRGLFMHFYSNLQHALKGAFSTQKKTNGWFWAIRWRSGFLHSKSPFESKTQLHFFLNDLTLIATLSLSYLTLSYSSRSDLRDTIWCKMSDWRGQMWDVMWLVNLMWCNEMCDVWWFHFLWLCLDSIDSDSDYCVVLFLQVHNFMSCHKSYQNIANQCKS